MSFLARHWSTLLLIGIVAAWVGISMGTNRCASCVVGGIVKSALGTPSQCERPKDAKIAAPAPPAWQVTDIRGHDFSSEEFQGKVGVVVYWATYCSGCKKDIPDLVAIRKEFPEHEVVMIALSVDEESKDLLAFANAKGINYRIARINDSVKDVYGKIESIPTIVLIDPQGRVHFKFAGQIAHDTLAERIRTLLPPALATR